MALTNDSDSLLTCLVLNKIKGWQINYFYDFNKLYQIKQSDIPAVMVDGELTGNKRCIGNHPTMFTPDDNFNNQAINLNIIERISRENYFHKYAMSSLLEVLSIFNFNLDSMTTEQLMIILAVDYSFKGFYSSHENDKNSNKHFLVDVLQFPQLYKIEQEHQEQEFRDIAELFNMYEEIFINDEGKLHTKIDLHGLSKLFNTKIELPSDKFMVRQEFKNIRCPLSQNATSISYSKVFSYAITGRNYISASLY